MGKTCIVQVDINPEIQTGGWDDVSIQRYNREIIDHSVDSAQRYARYIGADHVLYTEPKWPQYHPQVELFRVLYDLKYKHYDYICVIDVDIICHTRDNIFADCKMDRVNYVEPNPHEYNMFNSGTVVFGKHIYSHILFHHNLERANMMMNTDQQELQVLLDVLQCGHIIPNKWNNYMNLDSCEGFLHFKGGFKQKHYPRLKERISEDLYSYNG